MLHNFRDDTLNSRSRFIYHLTVVIDNFISNFEWSIEKRLIGVGTTGHVAFITPQSIPSFPFRSTVTFQLFCTLEPTLLR